MQTLSFYDFFQNDARRFLDRAICLALDEDGPDLTSQGLFAYKDSLTAVIVAKEPTLTAGLPIIPLILEKCGSLNSCLIHIMAEEGEMLKPGDVAAEIMGPAVVLLKAERVILNFVTHLSGIANLVHKYVNQLQDSHTKLLDTRKTLPGLRYPEKYAVRVGGGLNHRIDLAEMLMLKDNHIDRAGSITLAIQALRERYQPCPPIEVECRDENEVREAVESGAERIMLDNVGLDELERLLGIIPDSIETEVSGGVNLDNIAAIGKCGPDYVSVGRLTHSAPAADFSMRIRSQT